jgi:GntR family transcriptional regulator
MSESPELVLDGGDPVARQIEGQIRGLVLGGALRPGEELPTVRAVAVGLAVSPRAVESAYGELERAGWLTSADGDGPRVAPPPAETENRDLMELCEALLREAAGRGHSSAAVLHALAACLQGRSGHGQAR